MKKKKTKPLSSESGYTDSQQYRWNLIYKDRGLEFLYIKSLGPYRDIFLNYYLIFHMGVSIYLGICSIISYLEGESSFLKLPLSILNAFTLTACYCLSKGKKKKDRYLQYKITFLNLYSQTLLQELISMVFGKQDKYLLLGIRASFYELSLLAPLIARCSWWTSLATCFSLIFYITLQPLGWSEFPEKIEAIPTLIILKNTIFIIFLAFRKEFLEREEFKKKLANEDSLRDLQKIMREVFPCCVFIFKNSELKFFNQEASRMFKMKTKEKLLVELQSIMIIKNNQKDEGVIYSTEMPCLESEKLSNNNHNNGNLFELLNMRQGHILDYEYEEFRGFSRPEPHSKKEIHDQEEEIFYSIKICKISWEGSDAMMIIITEDLLYQQIRSLKEQSRYKDNLLATVSHDLRNPLNGVIGIIELTLSKVQDSWIKKK